MSFKIERTEIKGEGHAGSVEGTKWDGGRGQVLIGGLSARPPSLPCATSDLDAIRRGDLRSGGHVDADRFRRVRT